ncbi:uncharacterized protein LOC132731525 [Ruditapes philippinarum]|uniref:uncharacterized protein LOC132731525 n=1 Tax=Ruditapes philippinarum TaxID=129788 RepID=UPI00295B8DF1|nr:uncharacterized protein LOC132731525 [Ruditapes philippinarum]
MIYMSIILIKNPFLARDLLQYCNTIRSASKLNPAGWGKYDRLFRYKLAQYSSTKWSSVDAELWLLTMTNNHSLDLQYSKPCFDFNNKGYCTKYGCKYLHKCKICLGPHSFIICRSGHTSKKIGDISGNPPRFPRPPQHPTAFNIQSNIQVWIIGSSIIRDAFYHTQNVNFQLPGVDIFWEFQPGMRICHLQDMIFDLLGKHIPPNYLVVHCGGNDIGQSPLNNTELLAIQTIQEIQSVDANIKIIWSQILPRLVWRNEINHTKLNKARRRFNTTLSKYCIQTGGAYIRYPQISENRKYLYRDNVHISEAGNDIFISNLKHGLNAIIYGAATCFPEN